MGAGSRQRHSGRRHCLLHRCSSDLLCTCYHFSKQCSAAEGRDNEEESLQQPSSHPAAALCRTLPSRGSGDDFVVPQALEQAVEHLVAGGEVGRGGVYPSSHKGKLLQLPSTWSREARKHCQPHLSMHMAWNPVRRSLFTLLNQSAAGGHRLGAQGCRDRASM